MYLDKEQERSLQGERGDAVRWAMDVLVRLGDRTGAKRLVPVSSVHVPDWYRHRYSAEWERLASMVGRIDIPVTANPGGPDDDLAVARKAMLSTLRSNAPYAFSCVPYLAGNHPTERRAAAWGGRAAVAFVNSVLGARSETEDFSSAVASAITGLTAERGLLLKENRLPTVAVTVTGEVGRDIGLLGYHLSKVVKAQVPVLSGLRPDFDDIKRFAFAINGEGRVPLFHLHAPAPSADLEHLEVEPRDWRGEIDHREGLDLLLFGCPHLSEQDINRWGRYLAGRRSGRTEAWFFSSRLCLDKCPLTGAVLASRGRVLADRCPLSMAKEMAGRAVGCDSPALASCLSSAGVDCTALAYDELSRLLASG